MEKTIKQRESYCTPTIDVLAVEVRTTVLSSSTDGTTPDLTPGDETWD